MATTNGFNTLPSRDLGYTNSYSNSPPAEGQKDAAVHQRTYQACIPCRKRKVRCDLGSVDNPGDPPCKRCSRESKECYFSSTRRKKKGGGAAEGSTVGSEDDVVEIKQGRKRLRASLPPREDYDEEQEDEPRTPGGSVGRLQPLRRPQPQRPVRYTEEDAKASEQTAAILQGAEVHSGHDALKVLYEAAQIRDRMNSKEYMERPNFSGPSPSALPPATSPILERAGPSNYNQGRTGMYQNDQMWQNRRQESQTIGGSATTSTPADRANYASALKAWSRFRFVREGWFTAKEAIDYIQYFYKYLAPLTPVALPDFRSYESQEKLLVQEPMLTITMLLIATRHMKIDGPGSMSRPYEIHGRLWKYLQGMINRVVWGQEQFGGGFCGAGSEPASDVNPLSRKGLRTLGTVESLVLLTEWHPRMMHFPPDEADVELMLPSEPISTPGITDEDEVPKGIGGQRMDAWLEPCWRSDRMCWMLLGMAMSLAFEISVFDSSDWQRHARSMDGQPLSAEDLQTYDKRRGSVRDLLLVYVTQTSGRLGLTTVLPSNYSKPEDSDLFKRGVGQHGNLQETVLHFWLRMAALIREGNQNIFANKAFTRDLVKNGNYKAAIERMQEPLARWRHDFDNCPSIPKYMRCILMIEYEYCRTYINALALQAVAERCANEQPLQIFETPQEVVARSAITTNGVRTDVAISPQTLVKWLGGDRKYMLAVGDAARNLLKIVVDGLYPGEYLRHAPVRTYFRIISVAIMLLKSFSLGASESDVADSLTLIDRTVTAIKECIVDDVHVASRFADLLNNLSQSLKPRLVRISADGRPTRSRRVSQYGTPVPTSAPLNEANQRLHAQQTQHQQYQQQATAGAMSNQQQQWTYNNHNNNFDPNTHTTNAYSNNPLLGISNDAYDLTGNDFSVMPPPNYLQSPNNQSMNSSNGTGAYDPVYGTNTFGAHNAPEDWLTLPLDALLSTNGTVDQTMYGPQIDGQDMLELLLGGSGGGQNGFNLGA